MAPDAVAGLQEAKTASLSSGLERARAAAMQLKGAKAEQAAREFESILLTSLFDSLQKSFCFDSQEDSAMPGAGDYRLMATRGLAEAVSNAGGIGIAKLVIDHLGNSQKTVGESERTGPDGNKVFGQAADPVSGML